MMDSSLVHEDVMVELRQAVLNETAWEGVRTVVRAWGANYRFLPCITKPTEFGLQIAYHVEAEGCKQVFVVLPSGQAAKVLREYEAGKGV